MIPRLFFNTGLELTSLVLAPDLIQAQNFASGQRSALDELPIWSRDTGQQITCFDRFDHNLDVQY